MLLLKEIADFYRFFRKTLKVEKTIVFYAEHQGYYPYLEGLIKKIVGEQGQVLCYVTSDPNDPILKKSQTQIKTFYLNKLLSFFMAFVNCKVFVMTLTDLGQYHLKRSVNPAHYVYVFHALVSTHMVYRQGAFDYYDSILCCGPHHVEEIRKHEKVNDLSKKILVEAGYYRLERIYEAYQKYLTKKISFSGKVTILIAPSWGVSNILESCADNLTVLLLDAGYRVIVRPHPEAIKRRPDLIDLLFSKFGNNQDFTLERSIATDDSLLAADILITDYSGIALEYAFGTERPVLYLDVPAKVRNPKFKELDIEPLELALRSKIGIIVSPEDLETIPQVVSNLIREKLSYKTAIAELRKQHLYAFRYSSDIGAKHIMGIVNEKQYS